MKSKLSVLSIGFRPFFLLASLIAILNPTFWVSSFSGHSEIDPFGSPMFWHGHEMVFGFTSALLAGFLLTASSNWTGAKPYSGAPLFFLVVMWLLERAAFFLPLSDNSFMILSNVFLPAFIIMLGVKLFDFPKQKYIFIPFLLAFLAAKICYSVGFVFSESTYESAGLNSGIALIRFAVFLIAGRVLPFFTKMKLGIENIEISKPVTIAAIAPILLLTIPNLSNISFAYSLILGLAIISNLYRNILMFRKGALKVPMLLVLHVGLNFMVLALIYELLSINFPQIDLNREALHASMTGGLGIVAIGILTRVSLGHTGRVIAADKWVVTAYVSIFIGACLRVFFPPLFPNFYETSLHYSSGFWTFGFLIFFLKFFKILTAPRPDQK